jgi:hypothetical protein
MSLPNSLRSNANERRYADYKKLGQTKDISKIKGEPFYGMRQLYNDFELDARYETSDMLLAKHKGLMGFIGWWTKLGYVYYTNKHEGFDQIILNFKHSQSQPQIAHCHRCRFYKTRKENRL